MVITLKTVNKIKFPVYVIPSGNWDRADGLLFLDGELVDDKNMPGDTLGIRRLQTPHKNLLRLTKQLNTHIGLLKQPTRTFIDSNGTPFIYEKTKMCTVKYFKIKRIERKEVATVIWVQGIPSPFTVPRPPEDGMIWAGILHYHGLPWLLYEYSETKKPDTRRKV